MSECNCKQNDLEDMRNIDEFEEIEMDCFKEIKGEYENSFIEPLEIPFEFYNETNFNKGMEDYSYLAGALTAIVNAGVHPSEALAYFMNKDTIANNMKVAEITKTMNIEMSKNQIINSEKNQL